MSLDFTINLNPLERKPSDLSERLIPAAPMPEMPPPQPPSSPTITNYQTSILRGDVLIRPNTGHSNSAEGDSFIESVWKLRVANMVACALALLFEIPNLLGNIFALHPARAVLGIYLSFFAGLMCCFEFHNAWVDSIITDQLGILQHPIGRSIILVLMGGLALGQATILDVLLGVVFIANAVVTTGAFLRYPEYRRQTDEQVDLLQVAKSRARQYAWANPEAVTNFVAGGEREGLMRAVAESK